MVRFAICDDDYRFLRAFRTRVESYCARRKIPCQTSIFLTPSELWMARIESFDIVFLNVDMGYWDGINIARAVRLQSAHTLIIFVSAFVQFAPQGYGVGAFRYLLKNELDQSFAAAMDDALAARAPLEQLCVRVRKEEYTLPLEGISYVESEKRVLTFYLLGSREPELSCYRRLSDLDEELKGKGFLRIHKSFLANLRHVRDIRNYRATLTDGTELAASRQYYREVLHRFAEWKAHPN